MIIEKTIDFAGVFCIKREGDLVAGSVTSGYPIVNYRLDSNNFICTWAFLTLSNFKLNCLTVVQCSVIAA